MLSTKTFERLVAFIHVVAFLIPVRRYRLSTESVARSIGFFSTGFFFKVLLSSYWKSVHDNLGYKELLYYVKTITYAEQTVNSFGFSKLRLLVALFPMKL